MKAINEFIKFSRLHTIAGTTISIITVYLISLSFYRGDEIFLPGLLLTLISCLGANIYIVGLNQITDVAIDRLNKPYLPIASGAYTKKTATTIIIISVIISLLIAIIEGRYLLLTVVVSLVLGTIYSLPPIRLKRYYFWAAFCIIAVRGIMVNIFLYLHFQYMMRGLETIPSIIILLTFVIFIFSIIIAWYKDLPDTMGDAQFHINTLAIKLGRKAVFSIGNIIMIILYISLIIFPFIKLLPVSKFFSVLQLFFLCLYLWSTKRVNLEDHLSIKYYYQFIWLLFFFQYIAFAISMFV